MPLYEYRCTSCGEFRELRPMRESDAPQACPACGAPSERVLAAPFLAGADPGSRSMGPRNPTTGMPHLCGRGCSHSHGA
jgi:putative FmdB family regulatory protein